MTSYSTHCKMESWCSVVMKTSGVLSKKSLFIIGCQSNIKHSLLLSDVDWQRWK